MDNNQFDLGPVDNVPNNNAGNGQVEVPLLAPEAAPLPSPLPAPLLAPEAAPEAAPLPAPEAAQEQEASKSLSNTLIEEAGDDLVEEASPVVLGPPKPETRLQQELQDAGLYPDTTENKE